MGKLKKGKHGSGMYYRRQINIGNNKSKSFYGKTLAELNQKIDEWHSEHGSLVSSDITVAEYAYQQLELEKHKLETRTYQNYKSKIKKYIAHDPLGEKLITDVRPDDVKAAIIPAQSLSSSSYKEIYSLMTRTFRAAVKNKLIHDDPTVNLSAHGGTPNKPRTALSDEQLDTLLHAVDGLRIETFCRLGAYAGLRKSEILGLKWENVHLDDCNQPYIEVVTAWRVNHNRGMVTDKLKTAAAHRKIPIPNHLADHLRKKRAESPNACFVYEGVTGEPLSDTQFNNLWKTVIARTTRPRTYRRYTNGVVSKHDVAPQLGMHASNNPNVIYSMDFVPTTHQLRHTYITNLCHVSDDIKTIQYLAGHEKAKTTMDIYAEVKHTDPAKNAKLIQKAFESEDM